MEARSEADTRFRQPRCKRVAGNRASRNRRFREMDVLQQLEFGFPLLDVFSQRPLHHHNIRFQGR